MQLQLRDVANKPKLTFALALTFVYAQTRKLVNKANLSKFARSHYHWLGRSFVVVRLRCRSQSQSISRCELSALFVTFARSVPQSGRVSANAKALTGNELVRVERASDKSESERARCSPQLYCRANIDAGRRKRKSASYMCPMQMEAAQSLNGATKAPSRRATSKVPFKRRRKLDNCAQLSQSVESVGRFGAAQRAQRALYVSAVASERASD